MTMYWTGARKVLANLIDWVTFKHHNDITTAYNEAESATGKSVSLVSGAVFSGVHMDGTTSGVLWLSGISQGSFIDIFPHVTFPDSIGAAPTQGTIAAWIQFDNYDEVPDKTIYEYSRTGSAVDAEHTYARIFIGPDEKLGYVYSNASKLFGEHKFAVSGVNAILPSSNAEGSFVHIAVTSDGSTIRLYISGVEQTVSIAGANNANQGKWFGSMTSGTTDSDPASGTYGRHIGVSIISGVYRDAFSGKISDFRQASYPMTEEQIRDLAENKV